jgi:hypothetical protein
MAKAVILKTKNPIRKEVFGILRKNLKRNKVMT